MLGANEGCGTELVITSKIPVVATANGEYMISPPAQEGDAISGHLVAMAMTHMQYQSGGRSSRPLICSQVITQSLQAKSYILNHY